MKQTDLLQQQTTQDTNEKKDKKETLVERENVPGSNYIHITREGKHFLTIKNYKVTEEYNTEEELKEYMENSWMELMTRTMVVMYGICKEMDEILTKKETI